MIKLFADYHTHTTFSHGTGSIEDNVKAALKKGLKEVAISDHGPSFKLLGIKRADILLKMKEEIRSCQNKYPDIKILLGCEANIIGMDGEIDLPLDIIKELDILLVGLHRGVIPASMTDAWDYYFYYGLRRFSKKMAQKARENNTRALINCVNRYDVKFITHPGHRFSVDTGALAHACGEQGTALEINASHAYDMIPLLQAAMTESVSFVISSDAHHPTRVGDLQRGIEIAEQVGIGPERIINAY